MTNLVLLLTLLATARAPARAPATTSATASHPVEVAWIQGLPPDSLQRAQFLDGFQQAFEQDRLEREISGFAGWTAYTPMANTFRLCRTGSDRDAWSVRVNVVLPPIAGGTRTTWDNPGGGPPARVTKGWTDAKRRSARRMTVRVVALTANETRVGNAPEPVETSLQFPGPEPAGEGAPVAPLRGYDFPWRLAGRTSGLLALESLHHRSRDLGDRERLALPHAQRVDRQD